jgi:hypothetical protein
VLVRRLRRRRRRRRRRRTEATHCWPWRERNQQALNRKPHVKPKPLTQVADALLQRSDNRFNSSN